VKARLALVLAVVACAGCTGSLLESDVEAPVVYRLTSVPLADRGGRSPFALGVPRPRAAPSLDTDRIAVVQPDSRFDYIKGVRWSEPAPQMVQQLLVRALVDDGRFETVVASPSRVPADLVLDVELRRFESVYESGAASPRVVVEMQVTLVDALKSRRLGSLVATAKADADADRQAGVLAAFERATAEAIAGVVTPLRGLELPAAR
jgi:cholesterol transport system auxiliary component